VIQPSSDTKAALDLLMNSQLGNLTKADRNTSDVGSSSSSGDVIGGFADALKQGIEKVNTLSQERDQAVQTYAVGGNIELHQVMIAMEKSGTAMDLTVAVRNKLVQAYQEMTRMQL
jgi:flagellar hook-basal body complex protein FliE